MSSVMFSVFVGTSIFNYCTKQPINRSKTKELKIIRNEFSESGSNKIYKNIRVYSGVKYKFI